MSYLHKLYWCSNPEDYIIRTHKAVTASDPMQPALFEPDCRMR
jgi:hypothetical protein